MGSIYLIRHGQASLGDDDYDRLSAIGQHQSRVVGAHLAHTGLRLQRCLAGSLRRQQDTAALALAEMQRLGCPTPPLETDPAFDELDMAALIQALLPALLTEEPDAASILRNAVADPEAFERVVGLILTRWHRSEQAVNGVDSWQTFADRVSGALQALVEHAAQGHDIAVFTSAGPIVSQVHRLTGLPVDRAWDLAWQVVNTSITHISVTSSRPALRTFNGFAHLQLERSAQLITYR